MKVSYSRENGFSFGLVARIVSTKGEILRRLPSSSTCKYETSEHFDNTPIEIDLAGGELLALNPFSDFGEGKVEFRGREEDLAALDKPAGGMVGKYFVNFPHQRCRVSIPIHTLRDLATARVLGRDIKAIPADGEWHPIPYQWGDQTAAAYGRIVNGRWEIVEGCGDLTPIPDGRGGWTNEATIAVERWQEAEKAERRAALKAARAAFDANPCLNTALAEQAAYAAL